MDERPDSRPSEHSRCAGGLSRCKTKKALVLWGGNAGELVTGVAQAFSKTAIDIYGADEKKLFAQLTLVFGNTNSAIAFEHGLMSQRNALAEVIGTQCDSKVGARGLVLAAAMLGVLVSVLEPWQATGPDKSFGEQITTAHNQLLL
ncbi:MAG: hypothetical protein ACI83Y_001664 [Candidatus Azotimanducaceae bacterium]